MEDKTMGNQQETLLCEHFYAAGLMDGEGCFTITRIFFKENHPHYRPLVTFVNTNSALINWFSKYLEKNNISNYTRTDKRSDNKPCYEIKIYKFSSIKKFCELIIPYLIGKKDEAEILLRFINTRLNKMNKFNQERNGKGQFTNGKCPKYDEEETNMFNNLRSFKSYTYKGSSETTC